jgi:protein SCO1/2
MKRITRSVTALLLTVILACSAYGQTAGKPVLQDKDVEIGIIEHLGDTIPMDLWFFNEKNDTVTLGELIDKPTIMCFVYFDCPNLCSPLMDGIAETVSNLDLTLGKDYQIITISFNTKDTPEKAAEKKKNFVQNIGKENQSAWIYLTGTQENIDIITEAIGFKYKAQGLDFAHPSAIYVISPHGRITRYLYGLTFLPFDVKMAIIEAQKGIPRPTINKILEYCFAYNPGSKTYTLQVTRIMGAVIIIIMLTVFLFLILRKRKK